MPEMKTLYKRTKVLSEKTMHYCPGCSHSLVHKMISEIIEEFGIQENTIVVAPVGCAVYCMTTSCAIRLKRHTEGLLRSQPALSGSVRTKSSYQYQGDGDLLAIGIAETIHAANRGENITVIFINNAIYGMTGGQMAPTTLVGQKSSTPKAAESLQPKVIDRCMRTVEHIEGALFHRADQSHGFEIHHQNQKPPRKAIKTRWREKDIRLWKYSPIAQQLENDACQGK